MLQTCLRQTGRARVLTRFAWRDGNRSSSVGAEASVGAEPWHRVAATDTEARERANRLVDGHDVELWNGARLVARLKHRPVRPPQLVPFRPPVTNLFCIMFKTAPTENRLPVYLTAAMPRLLPAEKCPKCAGPLKRLPTMVGTVYVCAKCDADDPAKAAEKWIKGELRPPK
jgi:hypothetical protein